MKERICSWLNCWPVRALGLAFIACDKGLPQIKRATWLQGILFVRQHNCPEGVAFSVSHRSGLAICPYAFKSWYEAMKQAVRMLERISPDELLLPFTKIRHNESWIAASRECARQTDIEFVNPSKVIRTS